MSESHQIESQQPGRVLRAAREQAGLSLAQAADRLHLRASVVEALERESYGEFDSPVFLKGYFRAYCRLVNLHEERMLALLESRLGDHFDVLDQARLDRNREGQKRSRARGLKRVAVFGGIFLLVLALLLSQFLATPAIEKTGIEQSDVEPTVIEQTGTSSPPLPLAGPGESPKVPALELDQLPTVQTDSVGDADERAVDEVEEGATGVASSENPMLEPAADPVPQDLGSETEPDVSAVLTGVLVIEFDGDCWLKVSDGSGRVLAAALKRAGQRFETSEVGPFELVLGDARVVRLRYQGATYDLLPHTSRNGRAAFRLD